MFNNPNLFHLLLFQYWAMEAIPVLTGLVGKRRRGRNGQGFPRLTRWYCKKKPRHLEEKFTDEVRAHIYIYKSCV